MKLYDYEHFALARQRSGLSQKAVAADIGVSQGFLSQIETGLYPAPKRVLDYFDKITYVRRHELFAIYLKRLGITHREAKTEYNIKARDFNDMVRGDQTVPKRLMQHLKERVERLAV